MGGGGDHVHRSYISFCQSVFFPLPHMPETETKTSERGATLDGLYSLLQILVTGAGGGVGKRARAVALGAGGAYHMQIFMPDN